MSYLFFVSFHSFIYLTHIYSISSMCWPLCYEGYCGEPGRSDPQFHGNYSLLCLSGMMIKLLLMAYGIRIDISHYAILMCTTKYQL